VSGAGAATLTPVTPQRQAIEAPLGPILVLAGPGAGKTFCLIERIRYLIQHLGIAPDRIVAVTFTNKAAGEIAQRLAGVPGAEQVTRSTIHALCVRLLREFGSVVGLSPGFGIADEEYQVQALRRAGFYKGRWPLTNFSRHRIADAPLDEWLTGLYQRYRGVLDARGLLDFDDLVVQTERLLRIDEETARTITDRWDYLLVDEAQDLNPKQYAILSRLARDHGNIFVVGDDEQSIFSWAGADPRILRAFLNDHGLTRHIVLDENRRCSRQIFETARRLVAHNPKQHEKALRATRDSPWQVEVHGFAEDDAEAGWLIEDLLRDRAAEQFPWGEVAVLYRKHETGEALEARLIEAGVPCQLVPGRALADDPVIEYLAAVLRVLDRPDDPILAEQYARVVLPPTLFATLKADVDRRRSGFMEWLREVGRRAPRRDEDGRKIRRCLWALANLPALLDRHLTLPGLIAEVLSTRVGQYRTLLEEKFEEGVLSDPLVDPAASTLARRLEPALHGRRRVVLPGTGGLDLGLAALLRHGGITSVACRGPELTVSDEDVVVRHDDRGVHSLALTLFKALQVLHSRELSPAFADFTAIDIETSDLNINRCEAIELAAIRVRAGEPVAEFHRMIRPTRPIHPAATAIHGYRDQDLVDAPTFDTVWEEFRAFAGNDVLVAHNGHGFDFPVLTRLARGHPAGNQFPVYDTLPLARDLHPGSRKLTDLASAFGLDPGRAHHALDDTRTLARLLPRLEQQKLKRARTTALGMLLDHLAVAQALADPQELSPEDQSFLAIGRIHALGRYSEALTAYEAERSLAGVDAAPTREELIERLGGRGLMERLRREKSADDRYPRAMARLRRLLESAAGATLREQLTGFLDRVALSQSRGGPEVDRERVNLLTLHSTKGLEFSRVYIVGVEDAQLPGSAPGKEASRHDLEEGRRLLYVGMTRAKDRLVLTHAETRGGRAGGGTRYLEEMDLR
jgi:DNA polymerase III epsilon subunit family exonuclease